MLSRLLCHVGRHRPLLPGQWNLGYCFTTCERCRIDMVRSVLDGWKTPRNLKVTRGGSPARYEELDNYLRSRERPRPAAPEPVAAPRVPFLAGSPRKKPPAAAPTESPFDFSDFESLATPEPPPPPAKQTKAG